MSRFLACTLALSLLLLTSCAPPKQEARLLERRGSSMGSELHLSVWADDADRTHAAFDEVFSEMNRLENLMSTWRAGSEIQKLNTAAGKEPVLISPELLRLFATAHQISVWTDGKFDITFGAMSGLWKFDYQNEDETIPDHAEVLRRRGLINYRDLVIDEPAGTAFLRRAGMNANLGGIGKGYAVDRARAILNLHGFTNFLIQFGGDMYAAGHPGDRSWKLGIQDPRGEPNKIFAEIELADSTFSTSGDYERFFIKDGRRYHHIIDPATGEPAELCRSVTILTGNATIADGLSTGVFIMGPQKGMALVESLPDTQAVIVSSKNEVLVSSGLKDRLIMLAQPTEN